MNWTAGRTEELLLAQDYAGGLAREFYLVLLADGETGTRVVLRANLSGEGAGWTLIERIPNGMAVSERALGFEREYPLSVRTGQDAELRWRLGAGVPAQAERSYVLLRPLSADMARLWEAPLLEPLARNSTPNETQTANATAGGPASSRSAADNSSGAANTTSDSGAAGAPILGALAGIDTGQALIALVAVAGAGAAGAALVRRGAGNKKEE